MGKKILIILTSVSSNPTTGEPTGWYLPELAHPYDILVKAGFTDFESVSPKGGKAPLDPASVEAFKDDPICTQFLANAKAQDLVNNTKVPGQVKASDFAAVFYPGGHGPMFDLCNDTPTGKIAAEVYENGGVVSAVCHGPAGLIPVKLSNGDSILKGKSVTSFTNDEETAVNMTQHMPFALETRLTEFGAKFSKAAMFQEHLVVDGRLITGQNPASSASLGQAIVKQLK